MKMNKGHLAPLLLIWCKNNEQIYVPRFGIAKRKMTAGGEPGTGKIFPLTWISRYGNPSPPAGRTTFAALPEGNAPPAGIPERVSHPWNESFRLAADAPAVLPPHFPKQFSPPGGLSQEADFNRRERGRIRIVPGRHCSIPAQRRDFNSDFTHEVIVSGCTSGRNRYCAPSAFANCRALPSGA